jgi:lipopolysaccharide/colanic/teichoic acid biosynthesis glycosyltransferase
MIRFLDFIFSLLGIVILMPFFILVSILIKLNSKGSLIYKQSRVGLNNVDFFVFKFRTMKMNSDKSGLLTVGGKDPRITSIGYYLRKYKLDELPQLFNVLIGDMSLVGPRPEVRKYVDLYTKEQIRILDVRPGITDWASIIYRNENDILEKSLNPEQTYIEEIMPDKIGYNLIYINRYNVFQYFKIIIFTMLKILNSNIKFNVKPIV